MGLESMSEPDDLVLDDEEGDGKVEVDAETNEPFPSTQSAQ